MELFSAGGESESGLPAGSLGAISRECLIGGAHVVVIVVSDLDMVSG